jgi:hypothetical protein
MKERTMQSIEIRIKGKRTRVPALGFEGRTIVARGNWLKIASVHDENWVQGEVISCPDKLLAELKRNRFKADIFTFPQRIPDLKPRYSFPLEWDNAAAIPLLSYEDWWENRLPQETRKNVRRSAKRGVVARAAQPDDDFVRGVVAIYNETPVRQGKPFPKYGQDFQTVQKDLLLLAERSEYIGAYLGNELIGFVKLVYLGGVGSILSINSLNAHFDKRPTNIALAKAVEICAEKGMSHVLYGRYTYGKKQSSPLTEFKRRNGFEQINIPRYYIPLTFKGSIALRLKLHRRLIDLLPGQLIDFAVGLRARLFEKKKETERSDESNARLVEA